LRQQLLHLPSSLPSLWFLVCWVDACGSVATLHRAPGAVMAAARAAGIAIRDGAA
jgi:hypothetical protein